MMDKDHIESENKVFKYTAEMKPAEVLQHFVAVFESKGWLNRTIKIKRNDNRYAVMCSEKTFIAYRINNNWGLSPGIPGWPICIVDQDQIVEDSATSPFTPAEPGVRDWVHFISNNDFETM